MPGTRSFEVRPVDLPKTVEDPEARDFLDYLAIASQSMSERTGSTALSDDARAVLQGLRDRTHLRWTVFIAHESGEPVAAAQLAVPVDAADHADVSVFVPAVPAAPDREGHVLTAVEREAVAQGCSTIRTTSLHRRDDARGSVASGNGVGAVPADSLALAIAAAGYALGQVVRYSQLLRDETLDRRIAVLRPEASAHAGPDYRPVWWCGPTPPQWVDGLSAVLNRMSSDAPRGELDARDDPWDAERVNSRDAHMARIGGLIGVAGIVHEPTGRLVAVSELSIGADRSATTLTKNTLVLPEHRGHRLGLLAKCTALAEWARAVPDSPAVLTANAEENTHMLAVNTSIGFEPAWWSGAWQKHV